MGIYVCVLFMNNYRGDIDVDIATDVYLCG